MFPPAPGLFSTTNVFPSFSVRRVLTMRVSMSVVPPGVNATMTVTGWAG